MNFVKSDRTTKPKRCGIPTSPHAYPNPYTPWAGSFKNIFYRTETDTSLQSFSPRSWVSPSYLSIFGRMRVMRSLDPADDYLNRLRHWRNRPDADLSLGFLKKQFDRNVRRPYQQLASIAERWYALVPPALAQHTRLKSLHRGVLRVSVDSSAWLFDLDRILRSGLERQLITQHKGPSLRRIQLKVDGSREKTGRT